MLMKTNANNLDFSNLIVVNGAEDAPVCGPEGCTPTGDDDAVK